MYENYTRQSLPTKLYRELLGAALCVFNSNNGFIIENISRVDGENYDWWTLMDKKSGELHPIIRDTITQNSNHEIATLFKQIVGKRNRIVHSFRITYQGEQILATKDNNHHQFHITEEYLLEFIKENETLSSMLHKFREH